MSFIMEGPLEERVSEGSEENGKKLIANIALDTDYSLSITLMVYVASLNKWILKIRVIYHFYSFTEFFVAS